MLSLRRLFFCASKPGARINGRQKASQQGSKKLGRSGLNTLFFFSTLGQQVDKI
jgi:hypothetical protein